jgi:hypothetical protein
LCQYFSSSRFMVNLMRFFFLWIIRGCPKAYHPSCVNRDEAFFRAKGRWNCGMLLLWPLISVL